jgi:hypothetical protein
VLNRQPEPWHAPQSTGQPEQVSSAAQVPSPHAGTTVHPPHVDSQMSTQSVSHFVAQQ